MLDTLLLSSLSQELGPDDVAAALGVAQDEAQRLVDVARASGLIAPAHSRAFAAALHRSVAQIIGAARHHQVETSLLRTQLEQSTLSTELALRLAEHGLRDAGLAAALTDLAARNQDRPAMAARLYRAAIDGGRRRAQRQPRRRTGPDRGLCHRGPARRRAAGFRGAPPSGPRRCGSRPASRRTTAAPPRRRNCSRWLGPYPDAVVGAAAVVTALGVGDVATARAAATADVSGPPTSTARAARALAEGLLLTVDGGYPAALARLAQSVTEQTSAAVTPDTPSALVTIVGDARRRLGAGAQRHRPGRPGYRRRRGLRRRGGTPCLLGWARMLDGQLTAAAADAASVAGADLHRRDALVGRCPADRRRASRRRRRSRAEALVRAPWRCSPSTRWISMPCCRSASCGWPPPGCGRST